MPHPHICRSTRGALLTPLLLCLFVGCKSAPKQEPVPKTAYELVGGDMTPAELSTGRMIAEFDMRIRAWNRLMLGAESEDDRRDANLIEKELIRMTVKHEGELVDALRAASPKNRMVAATALGFARGRDVVPPLLTALEDSEQRVVSNALIGLALLEDASTPPGPILALMRDASLPETRSNAAYAARSILEAGASSSDFQTTARLALADPEPFVRTQALLILARLRDVDSVSSMGDLLFDPEHLVSAAAATALQVIGSQVPEAKGACARALVHAYENLEGPSKQRTLKTLRQLSRLNYGDDVTEWSDWAMRLP